MVTINDVAKLAGVSRGTVSNVINHVKVRPEYQEKVEQAIRTWGMSPTPMPGALNPTGPIPWLSFCPPFGFLFFPN